MTEKPLTRFIDSETPPYNLSQYEDAGGYQSVRNTVGQATPEKCLDIIKASGLRGRGGAGFPTGMKWSFVPMGDTAPRPKYIVANADEMEPGTFKDRLLMEGCPHGLIEGMIISAYSLQADIGYIFIRGEYIDAIERLNSAIQEARKKGYLGEKINGSNWNFELHLHTSAGRYICGEETALLNSLEGKRATPRAKPPFPQVSGLWGKPTVVNNVETLCNIPHIINHGPEWFKHLSRTEDSGTKLYGVSGHVNTPGCWELPMGITARELLEDYAGGMKNGYTLKTFLPGGASTPLLLPQHLDTPLDYTHIEKAGSRLGTGTMIIIDEQTDLIGAIKNLEHFFAQESCGYCTPCRDGLPWVEKTLDKLQSRQGTQEDIDWLHKATWMLDMGHTFCAHAPGAMGPLASALKYFPGEFNKGLCQRNAPGTTPPQPCPSETQAEGNKRQHRLHT